MKADAQLVACSRRIVFLIEAVVDLIRIGIVGSKVNDIADLIVNAVDFIWIPEPVFHLRRFAKNNEPRFFYGGIVIFQVEPLRCNRFINRMQPFHIAFLRDVKNRWSVGGVILQKCLRYCGINISKVYGG